MSGKGVGNRLKYRTNYALYCHFWPCFSAKRFWCHCAHRSLIWGRKLRSNRMDSFWKKNRKKTNKMTVFGQFWTNLGHLSQIRAMRFWCHCARRSTSRFLKNRSDNFRQIFIERSEEKLYECICSRNFFPSPKKNRTIAPETIMVNTALNAKTPNRVKSTKSHWNLAWVLWKRWKIRKVRLRSQSCPLKMKSFVVENPTEGSKKSTWLAIIKLAISN